MTTSSDILISSYDEVFVAVQQRERSQESADAILEMMRAVRKRNEAEGKSRLTTELQPPTICPA